MIHVSATHKVVCVPKEQRILNLFPNAKVLDLQGYSMTVLPHGYQETIMLRNLGFDVPAPILTQYEWPGDRVPFQVQKLTSALMTTNQRCYVLNGMGTGKTKSVYWAFDYLKKVNMAHRMLVVAPLSTLDNVWRSEGFRTCPHLSIGVLYGTRDKRLKILAEDHDVYVINPDGLRVMGDELIKRKDIDVFTLDELAMFRNQNERQKIAKRIAERKAWVWGLTGSPTPQAPTDAFGQCKIVTPHTVPKYFTHFRDEVMLKINQFKFAPKRDATEKVFKVMQPAVRFTLEDVTELPELIERTVDIKMGTTQEHIYEELRKHAFAAVQANKITAVNAGAVLNKLLQVSLGYVYADGRGVVHLDNSLRLDAIVDAVTASDRKVLVFVPFTHALEGIYAKLQKEGIETAMVFGDTPKRERDHTFNLFQNTTKYKAIAAHPGCMAHGLTLTAADTIIWAAPPLSYETFEQANARIRRVGQQFKQLILMFQSSASEKKMYASLRNRRNLQDNLLDLFAEHTEH